MKKFLLLLIVLWVPFILFAQPMDTTTAFYENFDGSTLHMTPSYTTGHGGTAGDWQTYSNLRVSVPNSFHTPVYSTIGISTATTQAIPLTNADVPNINHVYLSFDHICKINSSDFATLWISFANGVDEEGNYNWGTLSQLIFTNTSSFYYGSGTITAGKFNDACYSIWNSNSTSATPIASWWKHEYLDITSFLPASGATHFRLQFRENKTSPSGSGTEACAGWFIDNVHILYSNCELIKPTIALTAPIYVGTNTNTLNNIGPYNITARIFDNDTINLNSVHFTYNIDNGPIETVANTITNNTLNASGHTINYQWTLPSICYGSTIRYHIYAEDTHGSPTRLDTFLTAHHNYANIQQNDCRMDSLGTFPHCFISGQAQPVNVYFTNRSDSAHSVASGNRNQIALNVTLKVENANHVVTHNSTHNWTGNLCFDEHGNLNLGTFTPTHGFNYITVYVNTRNSVVDGNHTNDTLRFTGYSCDSLLHGTYTVGGTNPNFTDMQDVKASLSYCGIDGPVTFNFRPGTYQDFDFAENYIGQSSTNTVTFAGTNVDSVFIINNHPDAGTNLFGAVTLVNVNHFYFNNLTLSGNNNAVSRGVVVRGNGSSDIQFNGCHINTYPTNSIVTTSCGVSRTVAATSVPDTLTFTNCTITGGNFGIYYYGSSTRKNQITIQGCNISSCYRDVYTYYCNPLIQNNHLIQYPTSTQNFSGVYVDYAVGADINGNTIDNVIDAEYGIFLRYATLSDFFVRNNHVKVGNSNFGIYVGNSSATTTMNGYLYNNEVILYPVMATASYGMKVETCTNLQVTNNSLYVKSDAPYSNTAALMIQNNANTYLDNNILLNYCNSSDNTNYPIYLNGTSTVSGQYNDFVSLSGIIGYKTVTRNTISEWETAVTTSTNNISLPPQFANVTDNLLPTDFTGLECALNASVTTDIRGIQRNGLTYMGAYANTIASTDAAITFMTNPASGTCPEGNYNITVTIANKGAEALNFASHNAIVQVHSTALNLHQTVNITTGTIALLSTMSQIVANNVSIPVNQSIDFTFIITTQGDANHANDTLRTTFVMEAAIPDYDETFSNGSRQTWVIQQISGAGNWAFQEGTGTAPAIAPVYGTGRLFFNSRSFSNATVSRAIMPVVVLDSAVNPILEMWFAHDNGYSSTTYSNLEGVTVKISTNGGTTFTDLIPQGATTALIKRYKATATTPEWDLYTYDLSNYISSGCVYIAFDATSRNGNNLNIDRIRLRNLLNNDISVTNIYSQGETPSHLSLKHVNSALVRNEGRQTQTNIKVYLNVTGATEQYHDSLTIPTLASGAQTIVNFPDHLYNVNEVKNVQIRSRNDQNNNNNAANWRMVTTADIANYADTSAVGLKTGDYTNVIRPCVRYKINQELAVKAVKYYYNQSYISDTANGFRAFVSNSNGQIVATSNLISFSNLQIGNWYTIPINNFALTNMTNEFYVGIEMLAHGDYLCSQIETPLRDSTFYYLGTDGTYTAQTFGRFMIGAVVDTPYVHDLAILSLNNPTSRCDLGHEHITVTITNNGSQSIMPGTNMHYTVNGGAAVTATLNDTILSHETTTFTFATDYDFTNHLINIDVPYNITVWATAGAGDRLQYNDTLRTAIQSLGKAALPIVADTLNVNYHTTGTITPQMPSSISQGTFTWYSNTGYESWNLLGYGNSYTTPVIYFDTTYYVTANPGSIYDTIVGTGTVSGTQPFVFTSGYSRGRMLYTAEEIGHSGSITRVGIYVQSVANGANGIPMKIYIKNIQDATFPTTANIDWTSELTGAQLVVNDRIFFNHTGWYYFSLPTPLAYQSGSIELLTETNCADYCTGTGTQCYNCGTYISGGSGYPSFLATNLTSNGFVQYKNGNTAASLTGAYSNSVRRLNMEFMVVDLQCGSEKVPVHIHVPDIPTYDVETDSLIYPDGGCTLGNENIQVVVKNLLNTSIPANKVVIHAVFNGTEITQTIAEAFAPQELKTVTFTTPFNFAAPTANITFNHVVYTTLNNETIVYRGNDTITGSLISNYTFPVPAVINYTGNYTQPFTVQPTTLNTHYFYHNENDATPFYTGTSYTTPALYDTLTLWVSGKTNTSNCPTERIQVNINVFTPQYDLITNSLVSPTSFQCGIVNSPQIQVNVGNTDTTHTSVIPSGTFQLTAQFTGTNTASGTTLVSTPISSLHNSTITFANGINIGSNTQNNSYTYHIFSDPTTSMGVYRRNDTITGQLYIPANPLTPPALTYSTTYGNNYTVTPTSNILDYFYFYHNANDSDPFVQGHSFVTDPLYAASTVYYYSGRIEDNDFAHTYQVGTGTVQQQLPFSFANGHSAAVTLYSGSEIGGTAGRIDTIFINVVTANTSGASIPVKIWLKNVADTNQISTAAITLNWDNLKSSSQLILDEDMTFDHTGWLAIPIPGGFDYTGGAIYMLTEHNCGTTSCATTYGINPLPLFQNTAIQRKVVTKAQNTDITGSVSFALSTNRINTKFKFNYTCESPKSTITITTTAPQHDVGVTAITTPVAQNNSYTATEQVQITIKNFGTQVASNIPISYQLANNAAVTQTYTGSLAVGATATITFTTPVDLTSIYYATTFKAYTGFSTDTYHGNDTLTMTVSKEDPCISRPLSLGTGADISNVNFAGINNGPGTPFLNYNPAPNDGFYTDYTHSVAPANIVLGQTYPLSITHSYTTASATTVYKRVYIDYNRDGDFEDANEEVFQSDVISNAATDATTTTSITIPTDASLGLTRMRVICMAGNYNSPCGTYSFAGETEDYAVELASPFQNDVGFVSYVHPVGSICPDTTGKIRIIVKNFGLTTQSFSGPEPLTVTTTITGAVSGTYTTSLSSGSLAPGQQTTVVLNNVNLSAQGTYNLSTVLTYGPDQYAYNNTMSTVATVASNAIAHLPFTDNFDQNTGTDVLHFTSDWILENSSTSYRWEVHQGASPNNQYNVGPGSDHTQAGTIMAEYGRYAYVKGVNSNYNVSNPAWTSITTGCLDLHYKNTYPVEVNFYKHFLGQSNADFLMTVEVGSGSYFIPMDSLTKADGTQTLYSDPWSLHTTTLDGYDEVGRLRFKVTNQKYRIDPSIDDINVSSGLPDLAVNKIVYPIDFRDSAATCLIYNDTIYPIVELKNSGHTTINNYYVMGIASIGSLYDTIIEHITTPILSGDSITYTFQHGFAIPQEGYYYNVAVWGLVDLDKNPDNNTLRVVACTTVGIDTYEKENGVVLNQNVPNPAIEKTRITYLVPESGNAKLSIYSTTGQLLYSTSQGSMMGENYFDINTAHFAAGIYYYTLEYKDTLLTKKMVIQK